MRVITIFHWLTQWHELIIKYLLLLWIFIFKKPTEGYIYTFCKIECHFIFTTTCVWKNISFLIQLTPAFAIYFVWGIENNKRNLWFASVFLILGKKIILEYIIINWNRFSTTKINQKRRFLFLHNLWQIFKCSILLISACQQF